MKKDYLIILLLITNLTCAWFWYANKREAETQRIFAERNAMEATRQAQIAKQNAEEANRQRQIAEQQKVLADMERTKMSEQLAKLKQK
jgi:uncharacterized iron-regulated membrane protein